jgi:hypothetical protein
MSQTPPESSSDERYCIFTLLPDIRNCQHLVCNDLDWLAIRREEIEDANKCSPLSDLLWEIFDSVRGCELLREHMNPENWPEIEAKLERRRRVLATITQSWEEERIWEQEVREHLRVSTSEYFDRLINDPEFEKDDPFKQEIIQRARELDKGQLQQVLVSSKL